MINKDLNNNLQLTIKKTSFEKLISIQAELSALFGIELSKSQVIEHLISKYEIKKDNQAQAENKKQETKSASAQILALKNKLNVSYPRLAEIIGIPETTIKKYAQGKQAPSEKNKDKLKKALKEYNIKL